MGRLYQVLPFILWTSCAGLGACPPSVLRSLMCFHQTCFVTLFAQWCFGVSGFSVLIGFEANIIPNSTEHTWFICELQRSKGCSSCHSLLALLSLSLSFISLITLSLSFLAVHYLLTCPLARLNSNAVMSRGVAMQQRHRWWQQWNEKWMKKSTGLIQFSSVSNASVPRYQFIADMVLCIEQAS